MSYKAQLAKKIAQMMFVSGETGEILAETTTLIEQIVQQQVIEMVSLRPGDSERHSLTRENTQA